MGLLVNECDAISMTDVVQAYASHNERANAPHAQEAEVYSNAQIEVKALALKPRVPGREWARAHICLQLLRRAIIRLALHLVNDKGCVGEGHGGDPLQPLPHRGKRGPGDQVSGEEEEDDLEQPGDGLCDAQRRAHDGDELVHEGGGQVQQVAREPAHGIGDGPPRHDTRAFTLRPSPLSKRR